VKIFIFQPAFHFPWGFLTPQILQHQWRSWGLLVPLQGSSRIEGSSQPAISLQLHTEPSQKCPCSAKFFLRAATPLCSTNLIRLVLPDSHGLSSATIHLSQRRTSGENGRFLQQRNRANSTVLVGIIKPHSRIHRERTTPFGDSSPVSPGFAWVRHPRRGSSKWGWCSPIGEIHGLPILNSPGGRGFSLSLLHSHFHTKNEVT